MPDSNDTRMLKSSITAMSTQVLVHLRNNLRESAFEIAAEDFDSKTEIRFDTIPQVALEAVRKAYLSILDDPTALEALKRELSSGS
jgi:hypothetical protein